MTRFYVRRTARIRERVTALAIAMGVGGLSFYLARMILAREELESDTLPHMAREPGRHPLAEGKGTKGR